MASVFTKIINREIPGRIVWEDDQSIGFLSINPLRYGHTLIVPKREVDDWLDVPEGVRDHLFRVSHTVGAAIKAAFAPVKVGLLIAGLEVPHVHIHLVPIDDVHDLDFDRQMQDADPELMDDAAQRIVAALPIHGEKA